jgi:hypothetical protein
MIQVSIDGKPLTNIQSVIVNFKRGSNARGELHGDPDPLRVTIRRDCSLKADAQITPFEAAKRNPKKIKLEVRMPNSGGGDALHFEIENAFVSTWKLENISGQAASEVLHIIAGEAKLIVGQINASYKIPFTIPK